MHGNINDFTIRFRKKVTVHFNNGTSPENVDFKTFKQRYTIDASEAKELEKQKKLAFPEVSHAVVEYPLALLEKGVEIIDSPGLNDTEARNELSLGYVNNCHAILFVMRASQPCTLGERRYLENYIKSRGLTVFFLINAWDQVKESLIDPDDTEELAEAEEKLRRVFRANLAEYCQLDGYDMYDERVFEVSSIQALRRRLKNFDASLEGTGSTEFMSAISTFLTKERAVSEIRQARTLARLAYQHVNEAIERRVPLLEQDIDQLKQRIESVEPEFEKLTDISNQFQTEIRTVKRQKAREIADSFRTYVLKLGDNFESDFLRYQPELKLMDFLDKGKRAAFETALKQAFEKYIHDKLAAFSVIGEQRYGEELQTQITLTDGTEIKSRGTEVLQQYALLDEQRCMRSDVASIDVFYPHPFLQTGVELLDLPGTNDRQAQDDLVRDRLLTADLVVQVLDARKVMTLGERENLRHWLQDRGITTVVFVVNFLNLLKADDQKEVFHRLRFVAESFRSQLPPGVSNLYRVDALPALRARLKGDVAAAQTSGLSTFESALQTIVAVQKEQINNRLPRLQKVASQVKIALEAKKQAILAEIAALQANHQSKIEIKQKAETLIKQGFQASSGKFQSWLCLPSLLECYQGEIILALQQGSFDSWQEQFKLAILEHQKAICQWIDKACEFFNTKHPEKLAISFPPAPQISIPPPPTTKASSNDITPVAILAGFGWLLGGPVGAAVVGGVSYMLNQTGEQAQPESTSNYQQQITQIYTIAAKDYLTSFSKDALTALDQYEEIALQSIEFQKSKESLEATKQTYQLQLINNLIEML